MRWKEKKKRGTICSGVQLQLKSVFDQQEEKRLENKGQRTPTYTTPLSGCLHPELSMSFHIPHFI